jgi:hypothetical protein
MESILKNFRVSHKFLAFPEKFSNNTSFSYPASQATVQNTHFRSYSFNHRVDPNFSLKNTEQLPIAHAILDLSLFI